MAHRPAHYRTVNEDEEAPPPYALEGTAVPDTLSSTRSSYPTMASTPYYPPMAQTAPTAPTAPAAPTSLPPPPAFYPQYPIMTTGPAAPHATELVPGLTGPPAVLQAVPSYPAMPAQNATSRQYSLPYPAMSAAATTPSNRHQQPYQHYTPYQPYQALSSSSSASPSPPLLSVPDLLGDNAIDVVSEPSTGMQGPEIVTSYKCRKCGQKLDSATSVCRKFHTPSVLRQENHIRRLTSPVMTEAGGDIAPASAAIVTPVTVSFSEYPAAPTAPPSISVGVENDLIDFGGDDDGSEDPFLSAEEKMSNLSLTSPSLAATAPFIVQESSPAPEPQPAPAIGEMPGFVTAYKCYKCGHRLDSETAVCKRLHTPGMIRQENHIRRITAAPKGEIEGRKSSEEEATAVDGDGNHGTDSIYLKNKSLRNEQRHQQQQPITPTESGLSRESLVSSSGSNSSRSAIATTAVVAPPVVLNGRYGGGDGNDGTSSIYLRRSVSVQNPVTTLKKFWRDGKKEIQFQANKRHSASQPREIVAPPPLIPTVQESYVHENHGYEPSGFLGRSNTYAGGGQLQQGHILHQQQQMTHSAQNEYVPHPAYNPALEQYDPQLDQIAPPPPPPEYAPESLLPRPSAPPRLPSWEPQHRT